MKSMKNLLMAGLMVALAGQAWGTGTTGAVSPAAVAKASAAANAVAAKVAAPEVKALAVVDIRGLDSLLSAAEEVAGPSLMPKGTARQQLSGFGSMALGVDPLSLLDTAAQQRLVVFQKGDKTGFALVLVPAGGPEQLMNSLKQAWPALDIPPAVAQALPPGTVVFEPQQPDTGRLFFMPRAPNQVVLLPNEARAGIRPAELYKLLQGLPLQLPATGQIAAAMNVDTYIELLRWQNSRKPANRQPQDFDAAINRIRDVQAMAMGLEVKNGAFLLNFVSKFRPGSNMALRNEGLMGAPTHATSSVWLPGSIAATVIHTYEPDSEAMNIFKLDVLDLCTHATSDPVLGAKLAEFARLIFDLEEPFGPNAGMAIFPGVPGKELPFACYLELADDSVRGPKADAFFQSIPKRFFHLADKLSDQKIFGPARKAPLPIVFEKAGSGDIDGVPFDSWKVILTDCKENQELGGDLPRTISSFDVAWLDDAIIIGDGGDDTELGMAAILTRLNVTNSVVVPDTALFQKALPIDCSDAVNAGYVQTIALFKASLRFLARLGVEVEDVQTMVDGIDVPGTISYATHVPSPTLMSQSLGVSLDELHAIIEYSMNAFGNEMQGAIAGETTEDDENFDFNDDFGGPFDELEDDAAPAPVDAVGIETPAPAAVKTGVK